MKLQPPLQNPPVAKKVPHRTETHGDLRIDDYFWLREKTNPEVIQLLKDENAFTDAVLKPIEKQRESLFSEMKARIKEDDQAVPYFLGGYYYYTRVEAEKQYAIFCRKHRGLDAIEEIVLDCNVLASGKKYFRLGAYEISPDQNRLAYAVDEDGSEKYTLYFLDLRTRALADETIVGTNASIEWANDNHTVFYTMLDANERPDRLLRHTLGADPANDVLIYKEEDSQLFVSVSKSRSKRYLFLDLQGKITSETHFLNADCPLDAFQVVEKRRRGVLYSVEHHENHFYIVTNDQVQNFRLVKASIQAPQASNWQEVRRGSERLFIEGCDAFKNYLILHEREDGLEQLRIMDFGTGKDHLVEFSEPAYSLGGEANPEYDRNIFRFSYGSLTTPNTVFDYHLDTRQREVKKIQTIPGGYDSSQYRSERIFANAADGTKIPISILYRLDAHQNFERNGEHPLYLYGYGSYGLSMKPGFSTARLSLVDRGFIFAIAHIRGGSELGRQWYEDGKFLKKENTFSDFIACAEHLIREGYTKKGEIAISGGSAGGLLVGATINLRPELFKAAVARVPFVDVVNTMLDASLPLTTIEYEEWGNPSDPTYYQYMKSYSPYDNVRAQNYPHLLVTSGLNDPRVTYWEPAKWVAKLRELKTDQNLLLQHINMEAGHGGASGRYESIKETALEYAFLLMIFDRQNSDSKVFFKEA